MLNWAARYFPIVRLLRSHLKTSDTLLEIGSGSIGIGMFYPKPFVGCEINFLFTPRKPMLPVVASATALPFFDRSFDAVVVSDVLEHVPPELRTAVIYESLRVTRKVAIFGFPSGATAFKYDLEIAGVYDRTQQTRPVWLDEHLRYQPFPTEKLFDGFRQDWEVDVVDNENVAFHNLVMRCERHPVIARFFRGLLVALPRATEWLLRQADRRPFYRKIVMLRRADANFV